ncbi:hypothetical protein [Vibrio hangzhouensis]|uniref:hypothetical protein n=1 Tax=Vibrio hangzhouensis TaxID=462991 RepID=UPI001C94E0FB|nr:hypothetical protein [Vibrio hangzhouensis]MBY6198248.1 hypothetical protein [Vibrio hangzhouensis]
MEQSQALVSDKVAGQFVDLNGERYYKISNVDQMAPFFISVVSASNHWLFISSTGSLSAGRIRPENALFPYRSVDHIHENAQNTGSKAIIKVNKGDGKVALWEPYNEFHDGLYDVQRNIYKNAIGDKIVFEELNNTLEVGYRYSWSSGDRFGFVRETELVNLSDKSVSLEVMDGIQNLLPSGAPLQALQTRSALVDAYKWNERVGELPMATYSMYAKLSDRAEPAESLRTTVVFSLAEQAQTVLLSASELARFRKGLPFENATLTRGERGAYFVHQAVELAEGAKETWAIVADIDKTHSDVTSMKNMLVLEDDLLDTVHADIDSNNQELKLLMSGADAWQLTSSEETSVHHYANVLFNNMRGGVFVEGYQLEVADVKETFARTNKAVTEKHQAFLSALPATISHPELVSLAKETGDSQLVRLCYEYLPLTFGRRHGDPSRPWNHYEIKVRDEEGQRLLAYQGNWRDIFQNWEAIALSYPNYISSFVAKFVNASTIDGYNPYRITKDGVDWELLELDDPWSNIGYWGDHQIIYLLKFLELADKYQSNDLISWLTENNYSYANVPYELCGVEQLFNNPKDTVAFSTAKQEATEEMTKVLGSDGRLVLDADGAVYHVNLLEKLLVPLLSKLSNLVVDGGIWLNTQRPEWNDANNAIVGNGLSMVTLYYMRRYVTFMQKLLCRAPVNVELSNEVSTWMLNTIEVLSDAAATIRLKDVDAKARKTLLVKLEEAAAQYREEVYQQGFSGKSVLDMSKVESLLNVSLTLLDQTIHNNKREDGLYNAYNILDVNADEARVEELYPMLEGQVAILSAGILDSKQVIALLENLFNSEMYREDQRSFMLYPDRQLAGYMQKNQVTRDVIEGNPLLKVMLDNQDKRIVSEDIERKVHFNADFENAEVLRQRMAAVKGDYPEYGDKEWQQVLDLYEETFNHKAFTGRSGTMFGYEGLGCIYWHMVSKLLLAVQENYQRSWVESGDSEETRKLADFYYKVREGIGFNKTPEVYGAFPTDPYSHTPKQAGAQQPGMTGQVKEEVITRFGELGLLVQDGEIQIDPSLLYAGEFLTKDEEFTYYTMDHAKAAFTVNKGELAFTYCQVPFVYQLDDNVRDVSIELLMSSGESKSVQSHIVPESLSKQIFNRTGAIDKVIVTIPKSRLL